MKSIKNKVFNLLRKEALRIVTGKLGKVEETEDKIICHVNIKKCKDDRYTITIPCRGINEQTEELARVYKINKPICYVIENITVNKKRVFIFGYNDTEVIVKDCEFKRHTSGHVNGKCTIQNTIFNSFALCSFGAKNLILKDMDIKNPIPYSSSLSIHLNASEDIELIDTTLGRFNEQTISKLQAGNTIKLQNTKIQGNRILLQGKQIQSDDKSLLEADDYVKIESEDFDKLRINAPLIKYQEQEIKPSTEESVFERIVDLQKQERAKLIDVLKAIKANCEEYNNQALSQYEIQLQEEPIKRKLKKEDRNNE